MTSANDLDSLNDNCFGELLKIIHQLTGITISPTRKSMVQGRVQKRLKANSLKSYEDYLKFLKDNKAEQVAFIDLMTTNETYFFRTPRVWNYIENTFLPVWVKSNPKGTLRAWSAASSTGDEAHSLGILFQDFKEKHPGFTYQIVGTDISQAMVKRCQEGRYSGRALEVFKSTKASIFQKYMKASGNNSEYQVVEEIRSRIQFRQHNLFSVLPSNERFDLVLLRNVLIYFVPKDQEIVLNHVASRITNKGKLIIGESESLSFVKSDFNLIEPLIYERATSTQKVKEVS